jgi:Lrp/AsnC family leucine-responsive transcriptional regulator
MTDSIDEIDLKILRQLQENCRLTTKELASRVNLSTTPVFERLKRLESSGYISGYVAKLDADKLDMGFVVYCNVKLEQINKEKALEFIQQIQSIPEVTECYNVSGRFDYLLKIHAKSMKNYQEFIINRLGIIGNIGSIESTFVMEQIKQNIGIPI